MAQKCLMKKDLAKLIANNNHPIENKEAEWLIDVVLDAIKSSVFSGKCVQIYGFGKFFVKQRKGRVSVLKNRKTGEMETVKSLPHAVLRFEPSPTLSNELRKKFEEKNTD